MIKESRNYKSRCLYLCQGNIMVDSDKLKPKFVPKKPNKEKELWGSNSWYARSAISFCPRVEFVTVDTQSKIRAFGPLYNKIIY